MPIQGSEMTETYVEGDVLMAGMNMLPLREDLSSGQGRCREMVSWGSTAQGG